METKNQNSIWSEFTKKYSLQKTLRFELEPVGRTEEFLKQNKIFEKDKTIDDSYNQAKFYFDVLHREFIESALKPENIDISIFKDFAKNFEEQNKIIKEKKSQKNNQNISKEEKQKIQKEINDAQDKINKARIDFYKEIDKLFKNEIKKWNNYYKKNLKLKENKEDEDSDEKKESENNILFSKHVIDILKNKFPEEKNEEFIKKGWPSLYIKDSTNEENKIYIFKSFDKFTTYLTKFQETRKNLYSHEGESTSVITRIVSNFEIFLKNKEVFENKYFNTYKDIGFTRTDIFQVEYYINCLTQSGIEKLENTENDKTSYNKIIGEINQKIKEYRDKTKKDKNDLPLFKKLEKQILGHIEKEKKLINSQDNRKEEEIFLERFKEFIDMNEKRIPIAKSLMNDLVNEKFENEYDGIYLRKKAINTISRKWFCDYNDFLFKLPQSSKSKYKESPETKKFISLKDIKNVILEMDGDIFKSKYYIEDNKDGIISKNENKWIQFLKIWKNEFDNLFIDKKYENGLIVYGYDNSLANAKLLNSFSKNKNEIAIVQNYSDSSFKIHEMIKYFSLESKNSKEIPTDFSNEFYVAFDEYYKDYEFIKYYDAFKDYLTKKPYSEEKIKLNFENPQLLTGFDQNKESEKGGVILRKDNIYYLAIINKKFNKVFDENQNSDAYKVSSTDSFYEKMVYRLFPNAARMIPKICFAKENKEKFGLTKEIEEIKKDFEKFQEDRKKNKDLKFDKDKLTKLIAYYQNCLELGGYKKTFDFKWENPEKYSNMSEFISEINKRGYSLKFVPIKESYIKEKNNNGQIYLFKILNKDLKKQNKKSKQNIHTLYFNVLFSKENLERKEILLRLAGNAEVFYRPKSLSPQIELRGEKNKKEIIKHKRYTKDKILFHLPIKINDPYNRNSNIKSFNSSVNKLLKEKINEINVIGIDRGEKNLLYYTVINQNGEILEHGSLNEINGVNYFEKLVEKERERKLQRQSWLPIVQIKDLKKGYLSYVIKKICDLIEKYNAIVVLEDLNMTFKQVRSGIERTIYQQFEKALIDKLGYLVFKDDRGLNDPGGILNGYQLTAPIKSFKEIQKQVGIIFYTDASYTSKTDPLTGFRKNIYIKNSAPIKKIKELINKLKFSGWDNKEMSYYFTYNFNDFYKNSINKECTIYSKVPRIRREKNQKTGHWEYSEVDLNREFEDLFTKYNFDSKKENILDDIKNSIKNNDKFLNEKNEFDGKQKNFYERFIYLFNLILEIRNTYSLSVEINDNGKLEKINYGIDFIVSPVKPFFTTQGINKIVSFNENNKEEKKIKIEPKANFDIFEKKFITDNSRKNMQNFDSDGVGAYNIARKGLIILKSIEQNPDNPNLFITQKEWDEFAQFQWNPTYQSQK